ncbi:MAG: hypothetical protein ACI9KF_000561 [Arenicella sp.]|jgi:hypothetical protein
MLHLNLSFLLKLNIKLTLEPCKSKIFAEYLIKQTNLNLNNEKF